MESFAQLLLKPRVFLVIFSSLFLGGIALLVFGVWSLVAGHQTEDSVVVRTPGEGLSNYDPEREEVGQIKVDVSGGVQAPGVYTIPVGSRVVDAITAAGGFSESSDTAGISKEINLAAPIVDGEKIHIPLLGENAATMVLAVQRNPTETLISVNQASQAELEKLPGIGAKRAADIVAGRPFTTVAELHEREIISLSLFEKTKASLKL
jgi:competence protein ComEA